MKSANAILSSYGTTIFEAMSALAREHDAINLGQGFPDDVGPLDVRQAAADYLVNGHNQYPSMMGLPALRQAVAAHDKRFYDLDIDWQSEVMVTSGATEALADSLFGLLEPGDEVVLLEPLYDTYLPIIRRAGATARLVRLEPPSWELPRDALRAAFSARTKLIVLNSPMNPCGKVFARDELDFIAALCIEHDTYAVCDEVYEHVIFEAAKHVPLMTLPGMRERCVRIGSAGKTFSITGWKIGYIVAAPSLLKPIAKTHQFITFTSSPALQHGIALGLAKGDDFFAHLSTSMAKSRDRLATGLRALGYAVLPAQGSYFLTADISGVAPGERDVDFCKRLVTDARVAAIPMSAFYEGDGPSHFVRFCFCKKDETIDEGLRRLSTSC